MNSPTAFHLKLRMMAWSRRNIISFILHVTREFHPMKLLCEKAYTANPNDVQLFPRVKVT